MEIIVLASTYLLLLVTGIGLFLFVRKIQKEMEAEEKNLADMRRFADERWEEYIRKKNLMIES